MLSTRKLFTKSLRCTKRFLTTDVRKLGIFYEKTILTPGESFEIKHLWHPKIDAWSPVYRDMMEKFNFNYFTCPRLPINIGKFNMTKARQSPNVLRVPIKYDNSTEIRLPKELLPLKEELQRVLHYDYFVTGDIWKNMFCHITVHNAMVVPGQTQRYPGFHGDGLQGGKFKEKLICEHSYVVTDPEPTIISMQPYFVSHMNEDRDNIFIAFDQQVKKDSLYRMKPGNMYLIDPYIVHESPVITKEALRTFVRITTTPSELLMPKNTVNPMFEGQKYPERIEVREFVGEPDPEIPYDFYGITENK